MKSISERVADRDADQLQDIYADLHEDIFGRKPEVIAPHTITADQWLLMIEEIEDVPRATSHGDPDDTPGNLSSHHDGFRR